MSKGKIPSAQVEAARQGKNRYEAAGRSSKGIPRVRVNLNMPTGTTLLLVDDNGDRRSMFKQLLRESGYTIAASVNNAAKIGSAASQHKPDAIVISTGKPSKNLLKQIAEVQ
jgi:response regulator RpfG family c-di-GMP phosphodiesterase